MTCAGVVHPGYVEDLPDAVLERDMAIDYFGTLWCIRAALPSMLERASGTIVCISSFAGLMGVFGMAAYTPPKYAVRGLCETLRTELKPRGIHVASVYPTDVDTPGLAAEIPQHPPEQDAMQGKIKPISPEVVVDAILDGIARGRKRICGRLELVPRSPGERRAVSPTGSPTVRSRRRLRAQGRGVRRRTIVASASYAAYLKTSPSVGWLNTISMNVSTVPSSAITAWPRCTSSRRARRCSGSRRVAA